MSEQSADDAPVFAGEMMRREEIKDDVVVIAGVKRDVVAPGVGDGADHVDRLVAVERRHLDGDDVFDLGESTPEGVRQDTTTNGALEIKTDDGDHVGDSTGVGNELIFGCVSHRAKA